MNDPEVVDPKLLNRLKTVRERVTDLNLELTTQAVLSDPDRLRVIGQERAELEPIAKVADEIETLVAEYQGAQLLLEDADDDEFRDLALQEIDQLEVRLLSLSSEAQELLIPKDPLDGKASVIEVRAGTGGDEAGLFAKDLVRMYQRVAEREGWTVEILSISEGIPGSVKVAMENSVSKVAYTEYREFQRLRAKGEFTPLLLPLLCFQRLMMLMSKSIPMISGLMSLDLLDLEGSR